MIGSIIALVLIGVPAVWGMWDVINYDGWDGQMPEIGQ